MIAELAALVLMFVFGCLAGVVVEHRLYSHKIKRATFGLLRRQMAADQMTPEDVARGIIEFENPIGERIRAAHREHVGAHDARPW